jgi:hypothetical protein
VFILHWYSVTESIWSSNSLTAAGTDLSSMGKDKNFKPLAYAAVRQKSLVSVPITD